MAETQTGFVLMADISGYTAFLGESELEHARETLTSLLEVLVDRARPPWSSPSWKETRSSPTPPTATCSAARP